MAKISVEYTDVKRRQMLAIRGEASVIKAFD